MTRILALFLSAFVSEGLKQPSFRKLRGNKAARIRIRHSSSRFDRTFASLLWALSQYVRGRDIITFTEVANNKRFAALKRMPGWGVVRVGDGGPKSECAQMYRKSRVQPVWWFNTQLNNKGKPSSGWKEVFSLDVLWEHLRTGQTLLASCAHSPAHVENGDRWSSSEGDVLAYQEFLQLWPAKLNWYNGRSDVDEVVACGDFNVNMHRAHWRNMLANAFAPMKSIWRGNMPDEGSHKNTNRLIDGAFTTAETTDEGVGRLQRDSDHKAIFFVLWFKKILDWANWKTVVKARHERWERMK